MTVWQALAVAGAGLLLLGLGGLIVLALFFRPTPGPVGVAQYFFGVTILGGALLLAGAIGDVIPW